MAEEANSRHTTPNYRWGESAAEVPDAGVVEPSGGKKDVGWIPGVDGLVAEWQNWLSWAIGVAFRYLENVNELMWTRNSVMAGSAGSEGVVSFGVGLSVNVTACRVWISGKMQNCPAITNLALAAADPSDARTDLVVAKVVSSVPLYGIVTGTPGAGAPATPAGQVAIAEVSILAAGVVPFLQSDVREFGAVDLDSVRATNKLDVGEVASGGFMLRVRGGTGPVIGQESVTLGDHLDPMLEVSSDDTLEVDADRFRLMSAITRRFDIDAWGFEAYTAGAPSRGITEDWEVDPAQRMGAPVRIPNGCTITKVRVFGTKATDAAGVSVSLIARDKTTGSRTDLLPATANDGDLAGDFTIEVPGLSVVVDQTDLYYLRVTGEGTGETRVHGADVEYTEVAPFSTL